MQTIRSIHPEEVGQGGEVLEGGEPRLADGEHLQRGEVVVPEVDLPAALHPVQVQLLHLHKQSVLVGSQVQYFQQTGTFSDYCEHTVKVQGEDREDKVILRA